MNFYKPTNRSTNSFYSIEADKKGGKSSLPYAPPPTTVANDNMTIFVANNSTQIVHFRLRVISWRWGVLPPQDKNHPLPPGASEKSPMGQWKLPLNISFPRKCCIHEIHKTTPLLPSCAEKFVLRYCVTIWRLFFPSLWQPSFLQCVVSIDFSPPFLEGKGFWTKLPQVSTRCNILVLLLLLMGRRCYF